MPNKSATKIQNQQSVNYLWDNMKDASLWKLYLHFCMLLAGLFQQDAWPQLNIGNYAVIIIHK
ncbi:MAG: hypothetical protein DRP37_02365 [Thermodesulfobacteriota bacterium]|nr:MAG: hypothetical protein DRP37_02365 [Thermodesulfobacteriota bacterium]